MTGNKVSRLTFNVTPRLRWGLELMARKQKISQGYVLRLAFENMLDDNIVAKILMNKTFDMDKQTRLKNLYEYCPELLTEEELNQIKYPKK